MFTLGFATGYVVCKAARKLFGYYFPDEGKCDQNKLKPGGAADSEHDSAGSTTVPETIFQTAGFAAHLTEGQGTGDEEQIPEPVPPTEHEDDPVCSPAASDSTSMATDSATHLTQGNGAEEEEPAQEPASVTRQEEDAKCRIAAAEAPTTATEPAAHLTQGQESGHEDPTPEPVSLNRCEDDQICSPTASEASSNTTDSAVQIAEEKGAEVEEATQEPDCLTGQDEAAAEAATITSGSAPQLTQGKGAEEEEPTLEPASVTGQDEEPTCGTSPAETTTNTSGSSPNLTEGKGDAETEPTNKAASLTVKEEEPTCGTSAAETTSTGSSPDLTEEKGAGNGETTPEPADSSSCEKDSPSSTSASDPSPTGSPSQGIAVFRMEEISASVPCAEELTDDESEYRPADFYDDPCQYICAFPDDYSNSWLNATVQAVVNLTAVQKKMTQQPLESLMELSTTPMFASLFLSALDDPGKQIRKNKMLKTLKELSAEIPSIHLNQSNDAVDLLDPLLLWLDKCGAATSIKVEERGSCKGCKATISSISSLGSICSLSRQGENDSVAALLKDAFSPSQNSGECSACGSTLQREHVWNSPDILTVHLPQTVVNGSVPSVAPSDHVEIPVGKYKTQRYRLSSMICRDPDTDHSWSYLFCGPIIIEANDLDISIVTNVRPKDAYIYIYEKVRGGLTYNGPEWMKVSQLPDDTTEHRESKRGGETQGHRERTDTRTYQEDRHKNKAKGQTREPGKKTDTEQKKEDKPENKAKAQTREPGKKTATEPKKEDKPKNKAKGQTQEPGKNTETETQKEDKHENTSKGQKQKGNACFKIS